MEKNYNIVFFGTPNFAEVVLSELIKQDFPVKAVVTNPDKPVGREGQVVFSSVKKLALEKDISVLQPEDLNNPEFQDDLKKLKPNLAVVSSFGKIIPKKILDIFPKGAINVHGSLLPKLRGASPIQAAIISGLVETGVTIMLMDEKMDHGYILAQEKVAIEKKETFITLHDKLAKLGSKLLVKTIPLYLEEKIKTQSQNHQESTYTKIIRKEEGKIDWIDPAEVIERKIRALNPWPGTFFDWEGKRIKILEAEIIPENYEMGKFFIKNKNTLILGCSQGSLIIKKIQPEGKKVMSGEEFIRGYDIRISHE